MLRAERKSAGGDITGRHVRSHWSLPAFSLLATAAIASVWVLPAASGGLALAMEPTTHVGAAALLSPQSLMIEGTYEPSVSRDGYTVTVPEPEPVSVGVPFGGVPDPGTAQAIAYAMMAGMGWNDSEFACLVALWDRESHWNVYAHNPSSGAYGIPQSLPGDKMASAGADWQTNPATQITWGIGYIAGRYGTPVRRVGPLRDRRLVLSRARYRNLSDAKLRRCCSRSSTSSTPRTRPCSRSSASSASS